MLRLALKRFKLVAAADEVTVLLDEDQDHEEVRQRGLDVDGRRITAEPCKGLLRHGR